MGVHNGSLRITLTGYGGMVCGQLPRGLLACTARITLTGYGGMVWGLLGPDADELTTSIRNNQATCGPCIVMFGFIGRMADWHAVGIAISD